MLSCKTLLERSERIRNVGGDVAVLHLTLGCAERWKFEEKLRDISFFHIFALEEMITIRGAQRLW